jgi:hypothetical protein
MLKEARPYKVIIMEDDEHKRKNGGSPRHHLGDALVSGEFIPYRKAFDELKRQYPDLLMVESPDTFSWMGLGDDIEAAVLHTTSSNSNAAKIHGFLATLGLSNDIDHQVSVSADQLKILVGIGRVQRRERGR